MDVKSHQGDRFAAKPPPGLVAALVYGPDSGLVRERAEALAKSVVADLSDPFRVAELDGDALEADPARLSDEAAAFAMTGGRRVVRVSGAGNGLAKIFERFLDAPPGDALIVVEAGDLAKSAALRRVFENAENAAAIACYPDNAEGLETLVRAALKARGLAIEDAALAYAVSRLGSDRGVTRSEIEKLALYVMGEKTVTEAHVASVLEDESELRVDETLDAAAESDYARLDRSLARLWAAGTSPVGVLRQAMSHFQRLLSVRAEADEGGNLETAMNKMRPPLNYFRKSAFKAQAQRWNAEALSQALTHLYEGEALVKTTAVPAEAAAARALLAVAALGRSR